MNPSRVSKVLLLTAALALTLPACAAVDAFIWFENSDVAGESKDPKHMGWIEVSSFQLDQFRHAATTIGSATGGAGAGKVSFHEFQISKTTDKSSPKLMQAAATGKHFPNVIIEMRKAGGGQQEYLRFKLENVFISSYQAGNRSGPAGGSGGEFPTETMTFTFGVLKYEYTPQHTPTPGVRAVQAAAVGSLVNIPNAITKVSASAASASTGQVLTFPVEGTGACVRSRIDFGDGTVVEFPFTAGKSQPAPTHAYSKGGTFEVRAYGLADPWAKLPAPPQASEHVCSGHAFTNVSVRAPMALAPIRK